MADEPVQRGLQDVVALESQICFIDGKKGRLIYRGYDIRDLAEHSTFEEVAYLLWYGRLPTSNQLDELRRRLGGLRDLPEPVARVLAEMPVDANPMDVLRTAVSALAVYEPAETQPGSSSIGGALRLTAVLPTILGYFHRAGRASPRSSRTPPSPTACILNAIRGTERSELETRALDVALILHADHELNASTFAARVTASTLSDLYSVGDQRDRDPQGPAARRRDERVMELLDEIGARRPGRGGRSAPSSSATSGSWGSATGSTRSRTRARRSCASGRGKLGRGQGEPPLLRDPRRIEEVVQGEGPLPERRPLLRVGLHAPRRPEGPVHPDLRRESGRRLVGATSSRSTRTCG